VRTRSTRKFDRAFAVAPQAVRKIFLKQAEFLLEDIRHPSLRAKKYDETFNIWQARVNRDWRFYFSIAGDTYILLNIKRHPK
jgi:hypothetical protein